MSCNYHLCLLLTKKVTKYKTSHQTDKAEKSHLQKEKCTKNPTLHQMETHQVALHKSLSSCCRQCTVQNTKSPSQLFVKEICFNREQRKKLKLVRIRGTLRYNYYKPRSFSSTLEFSPHPLLWNDGKHTDGTIDQNELLFQQKKNKLQIPFCCHVWKHNTNWISHCTAQSISSNFTILTEKSL